MEKGECATRFVFHSPILESLKLPITYYYYYGAIWKLMSRQDFLSSLISCCIPVHRLHPPPNTWTAIKNYNNNIIRISYSKYLRNGKA